MVPQIRVFVQALTLLGWYGGWKLGEGTSGPSQAIDCDCGRSKRMNPLLPGAGTLPTAIAFCTFATRSQQQHHSAESVVEVIPWLCYATVVIGFRD
jgi:hypothetical protein